MANDEVFRRYLNQGEGQFLDRKSGRIAPTDLLQKFSGISDRTASRDLDDLVKLRLLHRVGRTFGTYHHAEGARYLLPNEI